MCWISGFGEAQQVFLKSDLKNLIQNFWVGTNSPCLLRLQIRKFLCRKITARFKLNLKTDGLDCKMIFKFGKHVERFHSTRKQCRRIYICLFCFAKYLLGTPKPLNCIRWMQAVLSKQNGNLFYFLRNSPYSHSARADIIALYLLVSSNREEKVSCASR